MFGNKDTDKKFPFPKSWADVIVVRQSNNAPGFNIEDPATAVLKPYELDVYDRLVKTEGFKGYNIAEVHNPNK